MSTEDDTLRPEDFADAALAAITDAAGHDIAGAAGLLAEAGLLGISAAEDDGGLGLGLEFALSLAAIAGREDLGFPFVEQMLLARAFAGTPQAAALIAGELVATIAWQGDVGLGLASQAPFAGVCGAVLVARDGEAVLFERDSLQVSEDPALDPERPQVWLGLAGAREIAVLDAEGFAALRREARLLQGAYVTGLAEAALETTAAYLETRTQFGRPLSAKQAVRHSLARMKLLVEKNKAALARALAADEFGAARDARAAFVTAAADAGFVLERAIHLHGAMGFTWEVPLHRALRAVRKIDAAFDTPAALRGLGKTFIDAA